MSRKPKETRSFHCLLMEVACLLFVEYVMRFLQVRSRFFTEKAPRSASNILCLSFEIVGIARCYSLAFCKIAA